MTEREVSFRVTRARAISPTRRTTDEQALVSYDDFNRAYWDARRKFREAGTMANSVLYQSAKAALQLCSPLHDRIEAGLARLAVDVDPPPGWDHRVMTTIELAPRRRPSWLSRLGRWLRGER